MKAEEETEITEVREGITYAPKVLMYHLITEEPFNNYSELFVRSSSFENHLKELTERGCEFLSAQEYTKTGGPPAILTFSDGYEDNYTNMFLILERQGAKATIFLVSGLIGTSGYLSESLIREMSESGLVSIQSHTADHADLSYQSRQLPAR